MHIILSYTRANGDNSVYLVPEETFTERQWEYLSEGRFDLFFEDQKGPQYFQKGYREFVKANRERVDDILKPFIVPRDNSREILNVDIRKSMALDLGWRITS